MSAKCLEQRLDHGGGCRLSTGRCRAGLCPGRALLTFPSKGAAWGSLTQALDQTGGEGREG